ncbi:MAG: TrmB family transcriptional regulator [Patescibacteria group bacterium]
MSILIPQHISDELRKLGLQKSEITIYLFLLQNGLSGPPEISRATGIARPNCYTTLQSLKASNFIEERRYGKRKKYSPKNPDNILNFIESKKQILNSLLPDLNAMHASKSGKPSVIFYEGFEEIKQLYNQTLEAEVAYGLASTNKLFKQNPDFFADHLKRCKARNMIFYDILTQDSKKEALEINKPILKGLYQMKFLPKDISLSADILIWNDKISLYSFEKDVTAMVIKNQQLADALKIIYKLAWDQLN